jgi:hypothetical protein
LSFKILRNSLLVCDILVPKLESTNSRPIILL